MIFISFAKPKRVHGTREDRRLFYGLVGFPPSIKKSVSGLRDARAKQLLSEFKKNKQWAMLEEASETAAVRASAILDEMESQGMAVEMLDEKTRKRLRGCIKVNLKFLTTYLGFCKQRKDAYKSFIAFLEFNAGKNAKFLESLEPD